MCKIQLLRLSASTPLVNADQDKLDDYGFSVDADTLILNQIAQLHFIDDGADSTNSDVRAQIRLV